MEEEDIEEDDEEVLAMIECTGGKGGGDKDKGNNKDIFETIKAFKE